MGIQNNFFTAFYSALGDPKNYYSFQKEMITKAMEDLYLNTYRGMSSFEATVIQVNPQSVNTQTQSLAVRVRPIIHDMFIPEPCSKFLTSEKMRKSVISMHPVAYSITAEDNIGDNSGAKEIGQSIQVGNTVVCYFGSGPNNSGQLRGLSFDPSTVKRGSGIDYNCLKGLEQERLGDRFESGQFQPMVTNDLGAIVDLPANTIDARNDPKLHPPSHGTIAQVKHIVIHYGAGSSFVADQKYGISDRGVGYHYGVERDGRIYQCANETELIYHAGDLNGKSIGINIVNVGYEREGFPAKPDWIEGTNQYSGLTGRWQPYTDTQIQAAADLVAEICKRHNLKAKGTSDGHPVIVGHDYATKIIFEYDKKGKSLKSDPGPAFPFDGFRNFVEIKMR